MSPISAFYDPYPMSASWTNEKALAPKALKLDASTTPDAITSEQLDALTAAYREAASSDGNARAL